jgi:hypothetical protein
MYVCVCVCVYIYIDAHLARRVESDLGGARKRRAADRDDLIHALLALERRRSGQMQQCRDMLWSHAGV